MDTLAFFELYTSTNKKKTLDKLKESGKTTEELKELVVDMIVAETKYL